MFDLDDLLNYARSLVADTSKTELTLNLPSIRKDVTVKAIEPSTLYHFLAANYPSIPSWSYLQNDVKFWKFVFSKAAGLTDEECNQLTQNNWDLLKVAWCALHEKALTSTRSFSFYG
jgi:hypothetical protein